VRISSDQKALAVLVLLVAATCLPFVHRAYFVDDFYHMTMAKGLLSHPWRPYDFLTDDAGKAVPGWERGHWPRMVNPPVFHYCMALVMKLWGDAIWKLRTASLLFSVIALFAMYALGKRFVKRPFAAAALLAVTPAYWLTSYSLLIDSGLIAFFMAGLWCFVVALERRRAWLAILAGTLFGLAILVKYFGVLILPVALLWQASDPERRRWRPGYGAYAVCFGLQLAWGLWNIATYGQMHFLAALPRGAHSSSVYGAALLFCLFVALAMRRRENNLPAIFVFACIIVAGLYRATSLRAWLEAMYLDKLMVVSAFMGGTVVFTWFGYRFLARRRPQTLAALVSVLAVLFWFLRSRFGGFSASQSLMFTMFAGAAAAFLLSIHSWISTNGGRRVTFLWMWLLLGLLELVVAMPWTAARYYLLILPPAIWLFMLMADSQDWRSIYYVAWGCSLVLGGSLAYADQAQANTIQKLAVLLKKDANVFAALSPRPPAHWYYLADTFDGSQPYIEPLGWENVFPEQEFHRGDLFLRARYRKSSW